MFIIERGDLIRLLVQSGVVGAMASMFIVSLRIGILWGDEGGQKMMLLALVTGAGACLSALYARTLAQRYLKPV